MKIYVTSVFVDDQSKALDFYTSKLGFVKKNDEPVGDARWLTVVSPQAPDGTELLLEPDGHRAVKPYKTALKQDGIPAASFQVEDIASDYARLNEAGVVFVQEPIDAGVVHMAIIDDTCGNLIQLIEMKTD